MERLEPVLKQKFWILLGIGIIMTIVGWWLATGTMAATITTRKSDIDAAEKKIPSGEIPNNEWSAGLATLNAQQDVAVKAASRILWERQRAVMTWTENVNDFAWEKGYQGEVKIAGREIYRTDYENDCIRVWETCQPFNQIDGSGVVDYPFSKFPRQKWIAAAPSAKAMWEAQEDLWLLEGLLRSIAELNGGANSTRLDACVHQIEKLTLHGGQPAGQRSSGAAPGGGGASSGPGGAVAMIPEGVGGFGAGAGAGSGGGGSNAASSDFDVKDEFGDDGDKGGGGGSGSGGAAGGVAMPAMGPMGGSGNQVATLKRYIDDDASLPFKTRGFYMTVIMDHRKIPNLIAELTANEKSAWPIEIVRVQFVRLHEDDTGTGTRGGGINIASAGEGSGPGAGIGEIGTFGAPASFDGGLSSGGGAGNGTQSQTAVAALKNALEDPNMARVSLCGIFSLYKEPPPEAAAPPTSAPPATAAPVAAAPATPAAPAAADSNSVEATGETKPATTTEGEPASPENKPATTSDAKPESGEPNSKDEKPKTDKPDDEKKEATPADPAEPKPTEKP